MPKGRSLCGSTSARVREGVDACAGVAWKRDGRVDASGEKS